MASSITYKAVVRQDQQRTDGGFNVKIRVTFKRQTRYIATNITASKADVVASSGALKNTAPLFAAQRLIARFYEYTAELNYFALEAMSVDDVVRFIRRRGSVGSGFRLDFFEYAERFLKTKAPGTAEVYGTAVSALRRYVGEDSLDISEFTLPMLRDFCRFVENEPKQRCRIIDGEKVLVPTGRPKKPGVSSAVYVRQLGVIYRAARDAYNDEDRGIMNVPRNPFARLKMHFSPSLLHTSRSPEFIQRLISSRGKCTARQSRAIDIYLISFALMGMNPADMMTAAKAEDGLLKYYRKKTAGRVGEKAAAVIRLDERIRPLLERYADPAGKLQFNFYLLYKDSPQLCQSVRRNLYTWAERNNEVPFTIYSARHTFASLARNECGIDKATVDECLIHVGRDSRMADFYIKKDWRHVWEANRKVLDLFDWSVLDHRKSPRIRRAPAMKKMK